MILISVNSHLLMLHWVYSLNHSYWRSQQLDFEAFSRALLLLVIPWAKKKKKKKKKKIKWSHTKCLVHGAQNKSNKTLFLFTIARFARLLAVRFSCSWLLIAVSGPKFYRNRRQRTLLYRLALQPFYFYFPFNAGFVPATTVVKAR